MSVDGGSKIAPQLQYLFTTTGEHTIVWDLIEPVIPFQAFMHVGNPLPIMSVQIGDGVTEIGNNAFYWNRMTGVTIPDSVTQIGNSVFVSSENLGSISLPSAITSIGDSAFSNCRNLNEVTLPTSLERLGRNAFSQTDIRTINLIPLYGYDNTFTWCSSLTSVTVASNTDYLQLDGTFRHCSSLTQFVIPQSCGVDLGDGAFADSALAVYSARTLQLHNYAFSGCTGLTSVDFVGDDLVQRIGGYNFKGTPLQTLTLPAALLFRTVIDGMPQLQTLHIGKTVQNYNLIFTQDDERGVFGVGCTALTAIHVYYTGNLVDLTAADISSDIPAGGTIYYYYKSSTELDVNSKAIADSLVALIGKGWHSESGGIA